MLEQIARRWNRRIAPAVAVTRDVLVPQVVGLIRPVILLPVSAMTGLAREELELVLTHEMAHLRRLDLWGAWVQRFAEVVLFFNPAVWFLSRRVSEFREYCCDDLVCGTGTQSEIHVRYAEALLRVVSLATAGRGEVSGLAALAVGGRSPSELRRRVARILREPVTEPFPRGGGVLTVLVAGLLWLGLPALIPTTGPVPTPGPAAVAAVPANVNSTQREFRLRVNGPDGKPVPNAECEVRNIPRIAAADVLVGRHTEDHRYGSVLATNERGELRFRRPAKAESLSLFVRVPGFGPYLAAWRKANGSEGIPDEFTITLEAGWTVAGRVVDQAGQPIAGATVSPSLQYRRRPGDEHEMGIGTRLTTDAEGSWRYEMVPESNDSVWVSIDHPDYAPTRMALRRSESEGKPGGVAKAIVLAKGLSVSGTVSDENGQRIAGATIRTKHMNETREAVSDKEGRCTLRGCEPKLSRIVCSAPGRARELRDVLIDPAMKPVDFTMPPGQHVRIRVLDEDGKGVANSRIFFQHWRGRSQYFEFDGVHQYTDAEGVWEWNEAPVDEFQADICRANGMMLRYETITPRDEEYVFRPARLLVVSGRVIDKATGEPIPRFRCVPGGRDEPAQKPGETWHGDETYTSNDGTYRISRDTAVPAHLLRIEADGYKVAKSRDIKSDEGDVRIDFELSRVAEVAITFRTPAGQPAPGADIALGIQDDQISIKNGEFTRQTYATRRLTTDAAGSVTLPDVGQPFELYVLHPSGFAQVLYKPGETPKQVPLIAWATVNGTIRAGDGPAANVGVTGYFRGTFQSDLCRVWCMSETRADSQGAFALSRVFPGTGKVGRHVVYMVRDGATEVASWKLEPVKCVAGETVTIEIGRGGRSVHGKLATPAGFPPEIVWSRLRLDLSPDLPQPLPQGLDVNDPEAYAKWQQSPEARDYEVKLQQWEERMDALPVFHASVDRDGSFRIDNVPPGKYVLSGWVGLSELKLALPTRPVEVPDPSGGEGDKPIVLGDIPLIAK